MKSASLTAQENQLLEDIIATYGSVVTSEQVASLLEDQTQQQVRKRLSALSKKGWLFRIKRGLYAVCDISTRGSLPFSELAVSNLLLPQSYLSFEGALQHHGMVDQLLGTLRSVSLKQFPATEVGGVVYQFVRTKERYFLGWDDAPIGPVRARIATAEKALIDLVQFHRTQYSVDLVIEILDTYRHRIDWKRLEEYLRFTPVSVQRIFGFSFDLLDQGVEAKAVEALIDRNTSRSHSRITRTSDVYDPRWGLYYDQYFHMYQTAKGRR